MVIKDAEDAVAKTTGRLGKWRRVGDGKTSREALSFSRVETTLCMNGELQTA